MPNRRISETIGVRYADLDCIAFIATDIKIMLQAHPEIDQTQTTIVNSIQFAASSLDIMLYTFTRTTQWVEFHEIKQDVMLKVAEIVALPTQTLHLADVANAVSAGQNLSLLKARNA